MMMANKKMTPGVVFRKALRLIRNPKRWTQGRAGRTVGGAGVAALSSDAVAWCSIGAVIRIAGTTERGAGSTVYGALVRGVGGYISAFNDNHTHAEVMDLWERVGLANGWIK